MRKQQFLKLLILLAISLLIFVFHLIFNGGTFISIGLSRFESAIINTVTSLIFVFIILGLAYRNEFFMVRVSKIIFSISPSNYKHDMYLSNERFESILKKIKEQAQINKAIVYSEKENRIVFVIQNRTTDIIDVQKDQQQTKIMIYKKLIYPIKQASSITENEIRSMLKMN